ncbi:MAG: Dna2/Cas4 domain-containing protein [Candidatus Lokiarchaeota archaeon]|nr:Dna2/Cas4 domain-containing protein [Candidatus Lokiarchaeota archaeon]
MSQYYNPQRTRNLYDPSSKEPFKLSRSKIDLFVECPRCFYIDRRLGTGRPPGYPFSLNSAVDALLKKEFDTHRAAQSAHPLMDAYGIDAVPFEHEKIDEWRENFKGVQFLHEPTNFIVTGAVDDVWINPQKELIVVDYKATAVNKEVTLEDEWKDGYKRQMEVYQWLLRQNGFIVNDTGYFVYANGSTENEAFDKKLEFDVTLLPYTGSDDWVEDTLKEIHECLNRDEVPKAGEDCDYCAYRDAVDSHLK